MRDLIKVFKAVSDKNRMRILKMLENKKMCVCEMAVVIGIARPSVSKHLRILKEAGLITDERNLQWIDYSLCNENINKYAPVIQSSIKEWLNDDPVINQDFIKIKTLSREEICKK